MAHSLLKKDTMMYFCHVLKFFKWLKRVKEEGEVLEDPSRTRRP